MKWDEEQDPEDMDDDDKHAFETFRKVIFQLRYCDYCSDSLQGDLRVHLDSISVIETDMVLTTVENLIMTTFTAYQSGTPVKWNEVELAIYLVYIFGDMNKSKFHFLLFLVSSVLIRSYLAGGKGRAAFCHAPAVAKEERKKTDYTDYPLTTHGELLFSMVRCGVSNYPHNAVTMQFFETCARYGDFFKVRKECIIPLLQAMVGPR